MKLSSTLKTCSLGVLVPMLVDVGLGKGKFCVKNQYFIVNPLHRIIKIDELTMIRAGRFIMISFKDFAQN